MKRPADIPDAPGVFIIAHDASKHVYANEARNLKERAGIWSSWFNKFDRDGTPIRVRSWPRELAATGDEWEFRFTTEPDVTVPKVYDYFVAAGWTAIRARPKHNTKFYTVQGVEATLFDHCRRLGIPNWSTVYKRVQRGATPEEALNLTR